MSVEYSPVLYERPPSVGHVTNHSHFVVRIGRLSFLWIAVKSVSNVGKATSSIERLFYCNIVYESFPSVVCLLKHSHSFILTLFLSHQFASGRHHYEKALRVRQMIHNDFKSVFSDNSADSADVLLTPVTLSSAPCQRSMKNMGPVESSIYDTYTVPVNLSGIDEPA